MKPRVIYIHGDHVISWRWGWVVPLQQELHAAGFPTFFELFPDSIEARAKYWLPFLTEHVQAGPKDVLLGWSCGAVAAMRYAENHRVKGLALVAPYYSDLGSKEVRRSGFTKARWNWERIRKNVERIAIFHSDEDPYVSQHEFRALAVHLQAQVVLVPNAGHFGNQDTFPELLGHLLRTYANDA